MPRLKDVNVEREILELMKDGKARSKREIQRALKREWNAIYWHLDGKPENLVKRGCLEKVKTFGELRHFAQDEYVYRKGKNFDACLRGEA